MNRAMKVSIALALGGLIGFGLPAPVRADDVKPTDGAKPADGNGVDENVAKVNELEVLAKKHLAEKTDDALATDIASAVKLYGQLADVKLKARLIVLIGTILQGNTHEAVQKPAIKAFGDLADPTGFRFLRPFLVQHTPDENPPLMLDAITSASKMHADDSVPPLLNLVQHSHIMPIAVAAMQAFTTFGKNKSTREKILSELVETVKKDRPGVGWRWSANQGVTGADRSRTAPTRTGEDTVSRYQALAGVMNETLNKMTGQNVAEPETWFDMKDNYKSRLSMLFPKE